MRHDADVIHFCLFLRGGLGLSVPSPSELIPQRFREPEPKSAAELTPIQPCRSRVHRSIDYLLAQKDCSRDTRVYLHHFLAHSSSPSCRVPVAELKRLANSPGWRAV
jgi:hypothetical protein